MFSYGLMCQSLILWSLVKSEVWTKLVLVAFLASLFCVHSLMLYEGELMLYSSTQWGTAKVLLLFSAVLFIKLEKLLILETPIALSGSDEIGWCVWCYSLGKESWRDGWTQTLHLTSLLFKKARLKGSLWNRDTNLGRERLPPSSISWPLNHSLVSAQWILKHSVQNSTAFPEGNENANFFPLSCQCHKWTCLQLMWVWVSSDTVEKGDLSPTFEKRFQSKAFENKQHYPCICVVFDLLGGTHDSTVTLKHQLVSCTFLLSFSGPWAWH